MSVCMIAIAIVSAVFNQQLINGVAIYGSQDKMTNTAYTPVVSYVILVLLCIFIAFFALSWYVYILVY